MEVKGTQANPYTMSEYEALANASGSMNNFTQDLLKSIILLAFLLTSCIQKVDKKSKSTDKAEEAYRTCAKDVYSSSSADLQAKQVFNNFMQFIEHFPKYESQDITDSIFRMETPLGLLGETHLIPDSVARQYIPMNEAEKEITDIVYCHYGQRIEFENFYALFFTKFIDLHDLKKPGYEYIARSIVTYSKDGRIIECKDVVKEGDLWRYEISGKSNPFMLLAKQHYIDSYADDPHAATPDSTKEYSFTFNESGNIIRERLSYSDTGNYTK